MGGGWLSVDTEIPGPGQVITSDVTLLNNTGELIFITEPRDLPDPARVVTRSVVTGRSFITEIPPIPAGPPDFFLAIKQVRFRLKAVSAGGRNYMTTPSNCPTRGFWVNRARFTYSDAVTQTRSSRSPCS